MGPSDLAGWATGAAPYVTPGAQTDPAYAYDPQKDPNSPYYNPSGVSALAPSGTHWQTADPNAPFYDPPGWKGGTFKTGWDTLDSALNTATGSGHISDIKQLYGATGGNDAKDIFTGKTESNVGGLLDRGVAVQGGVYDGNRPVPPLPGGGIAGAPAGGAPVAAPPASTGGDFYNSSADTGFYRYLADQRAQQAAPQLQRTSIDFSGQGSGQGGAPTQQPGATYGQNPVAGGDARLQAGIAAGAAAPVTYPEYPIVSSPPPPANPAMQAPTAMGAQIQGAQAPGATTFAPKPTTVMRAGSAPAGIGGIGSPAVSTAMPGQRDPNAVYAPPGAGTAAPVSYGGGSPQPQGNTSFGQVAAGNPNAMGAATPQNQPNAPAPPNGGGQFSNPLFQQGQESRQQQSDVMAHTADPGLYTNPQQKDAAQSRTAQTQVLRATGDPNAYATPDQATAAQSRGQQQGLMSILNRDIAGGGPSLAEQQLKQGTDANIATANALAASAGPQNAAAASRQAAQTAATAGQQLAGQTAALRAQEYAQARGELGTATTAARAQDLTNLGMDYSNTTNRLGLMTTNAANLRGADLQNQGQSYANTTAQAQLVAQEAQVKRAQDLQATGMSYDMAVKQAQLEADQNRTQLGAEIAQRGINSSQEMGLLGMGQTAQASEQEAREHAADLLMQKYGVDKNVALQMVGQTGIANVFKGVAAGGAAAGIPGAIAGGLAGYIYNRQQPSV